MGIITMLIRRTGIPGYRVSSLCCFPSQVMRRLSSTTINMDELDEKKKRIPPYRNTPRNKITEFIERTRKEYIKKQLKSETNKAYRKKDKLVDIRDLYDYNLQTLDLQPATIREVLRTVPRGSPRTKIVFVLNALDFPLGLSKHSRHLTKVKLIDRSNIYYVITNIDLVTKQYSSIDFELLKKYFVTGLNSYLSDLGLIIESKNVYITTKFKPESIDLLSEELENHHQSDIYFIGETNSGKSTLVSQVYKYISSKSHNPLERDSANKRYFKISDGLFTTRRNNEHHISFLDLMIIDTPGYASRKKGIYGMLHKSNRTKLRSQITKDDEQNLINLKSTFSRERFSIENYFYLNPRGVNFFKYKQNMFGKPTLYNNLKSALSNNTKKNELDKSFNIEKEYLSKEFQEEIKNNEHIEKLFKLKPYLRKYFLPPFRGRIDLVFQNVGYAELDNDDGFYSNEFWTIYKPHHLNSIIRSPSIDDYIKFGLGNDAFLERLQIVPLTEIPLHTSTKELLDKAIQEANDSNASNGAI